MNEQNNEIGNQLVVVVTTLFIKDLCDNWVKHTRGKITMEFYDDYG
jgi:hypothetical protein